MNKTVIFAAALAADLLIAAATPALAHEASELAGPDRETTHVTVSFADLDLVSAAGQAKLHRRIAGAANAACAAAGDGLAPAHAAYEINACRNTAMRSAETELAARGVTQHLALATGH